VTTFTYAEDGAWVNLARASYSKLSQLDGLGREIGASDSEGAITAVRYDAMGQAWFKSYPRKAVDPEVGEAFEFDGLGRVRARTVGYRPGTETAPARCDVPGACRATIYHYANCVGTTAQRAPGDEVTNWGCSTSYGDPAEGRLTQVSDAAGFLWNYEYTAHGELKSVRAPLAQGNRAYHHDAHQFLVGETTPESGAVEYSRNAAGQPTSRTDARPAHVGYHYDDDPLSRLRRITYEGALADDVTQSFDEANNLAQLKSENGGAFAYTYDGLNRPLTQIWEDQGPGGTRVTYTTSYGYDSAGCRETMSYPTGTSIAMECDTAGRVKRIELTAGAGAPRVLVEDVSYHASGQVKGVTYGNGVPTAYTYDDRARATRVEVGTVVDLRYGYDGVDNVTSYQDARVAGSARTMGYDPLDRLAWVDAPGLWGGSSYGYDELGNRTSRWENGEETFYAYDPETNRLARADGARGTLRALKLAWDVANRLVASSDGTTYRYDGRGRRVRKTSGGEATVYHYDAAGRVIAETRPDGTPLRDYVYLGNALVAVSGCVSDGSTPPCAEVEWYHTDRLGSVVARTDEAGLVAARLEYEPWGEVFTESGTAGVRQYNGRVYDPGTGFHDYGARMYWPQIGRFVSADSKLGSPADPRSLNRYSYVLNNPYKYVDPTGNDAVIVYYAGDANASFEKAARTQMVEMRASGNTEPIRAFPVTTETDLKNAWQSVSASGAEISQVTIFGHGGDGNLYFRPGAGADGTLTGSEIGKLPTLNYKAGASIDLHACNSANGSPSAAQSFADSQGVPAVGRTGFSYFSSTKAKYTPITGKDKSTYLDAYSRGRNSPLGSGKVMPTKEARP
jgi:RHS repeat-associated protein